MAYWATFFVAGRAAPKGSFSAMLIKGRPVAFARGANEIRAWERAVRTVASRYVPDDGPLDVPVCVKMVFSMRRPKKPKYSTPAVAPDVDKMARSTVDALSKHVFTDDKLVVRLRAEKIYGDVEGVQITVREYEEPAS